MGSKSAGNAERKRAAKILEENAAAIDAINLPDIEKMKLLSEVPELQGILQAQELGPSGMEDVTADAQAIEGQRSALSQLQEMVDQGGMSEADMANFRRLQRSNEASENARQQSILAEMQQRGTGGGGQELAARLASSQGATNRGAQSTDAMIAEMANARKQALSQLANQSGQFRAQGFQEQSSKAQARDAINQFNALQRANVAQQNLANRQNIENVRAATRNQDQAYNKGLQQTQFQNQMTKQAAKSGANQQLAQNLQAQAQAKAQASQSRMGAIGGVLSGVGTAFGGPAGGAIGSAAGAALSLENGGVKYQNGGIADNSLDNSQNMGDNNSTSAMLQKIEQLRNQINSSSDAQNAPLQGSEPVMNTMAPTQPQNAQMASQGFSGQQFENGGSKSELEQQMIEKLAEIRRRRGVLEALAKKNVAEEMDERNTSELEKFMMGTRDEYANGGLEVEAMEINPETGNRYDEDLDNGELEANGNAQDELLEVLRGLKAPEDMEEGRIIEGDSYSGDLLPDRINSGEAVNTVKMQDRNKEMLHEGSEAKAELEGIKSLLRMVGKRKDD